jgi:hypothetical protein
MINLVDGKHNILRWQLDARLSSLEENLNRFVTASGEGAY